MSEENPVSSSIAAQEPVAWLYSCFKPGKREVFASVDPDDTTHWPLDQWKEVKKEPLYLASLSAIVPLDRADILNQAITAVKDGLFCGNSHDDILATLYELRDDPENSKWARGRSESDSQ